MKKIVLLGIVLCLAISAKSQVGVNTVTPQASLDVTALRTSPTAVDGIIAPRLSGSELRNKNSLYTLAQTGAIIYAESSSPGAGVSGDKTTKVNTAGYYYFDGSIWLPFLTSAPNLVTVSNGLTKTNDEIKLGGVITGATTLSGITATNKLAFTATGVNAINFDSNTLSIDATNNRIGIGTAAPAQSLDVEGTMRLSQSVGANTPNSLSSANRPMYINQSTGQVEYAPNGFTSVSGGYRPGSSYLLKTLPRFSTICRVRFVCYINKSSETNNSKTEAYTYGDITLIGMGNANPIKFVESNIKGYDGQTKNLITNNSTSISWNNYTQGVTTLSIDQSTGQFWIRTEDGGNITTLSYFFEFLGGI